MVWSVPGPSIDNPDEDSKLINSKDSPEVLDAQAYDFAFVDSFLDFDSIVDWFEDIPAADMATQENNNDNGAVEKSVQMVEGDLLKECSFLDQQVMNDTVLNAAGSTRVVKAETPACEILGILGCTVDDGTSNGSEPIANGSSCLFKEEDSESGNVGTLSCAVEEGKGNGPEPIAIEPACVVNGEKMERENLGFSSCIIEEGLGNISLVGGCKSLVVNDGNGMKSDAINGENASESSESESASPSSSTSSNNDSDDSSDSDDDEVEEEQGGKKGKGQTGNIDVDCEEGEINDSHEKELDTENDDENEDVDKMVSWSDMIDEDGNDDGEVPKGPIRSKNELKNLPPVPPVDVTLGQHHQLQPVGIVMSVIGAQVIVEGVEKHDPLNEGSILWMTESRTPLGIVDEIFGPVRNPYYVVRYNSEDEVPKGVQGGTLISFVLEFAYHVLNKDLYKKGYDASGDNDEEMPNEAEFSDDEKEAEYKRMQKTMKRKNHRNKAPQEEGAVPTYPAASALPLRDLGSRPPFSDTRRGILGPTIMVPQFRPTAAGINPVSSVNWRNGNTFPQPQSSLLPNGFPANGVPGFSENAYSYQLPMLGIPFQQQSEPSQGLRPATMLPGVQPNIYAQPIYVQMLMDQNQMPSGLSSIDQHSRPSGMQGFFTNGMQSEGNYNLHSGSIPGNARPSGQFHLRAPAGRGRKAFRHGGRRGWRPTK